MHKHTLTEMLCLIPLARVAFQMITLQSAASARWTLSSGERDVGEGAGGGPNMGARRREVRYIWSERGMARMRVAVAVCESLCAGHGVCLGSEI